MTDEDLLALCVWDEAAGQPYEGKVAVARVIDNRMAILPGDDAPYESDGTPQGTVLAKDQFSGFWFDMVGGRYTRVCWTLAEAQKRAETLLIQAKAQRIWADCVRAIADAKLPTFPGAGPAYAKLAADPCALMYANLDVCSPAWATPDAFICKIFAHSFYEA